MNDFLARWALKEREYGLESISARMIPIGDTFLPDSAAPGLSFDTASEPVHVYDVFGAWADWTENDRERLSSYLMIGTDGAGNPICLDDAGAVILLDHEDGFRTIQFVNSSVSQLCECLLAYMGEEDASRFNYTVGLVDVAAMQPKSFWWYEAAALQAAA